MSILNNKITRRFLVFLEENLTPRTLNITFKPSEFSLDAIEAMVEKVQQPHAFGPSAKFWNIKNSGTELTFQDQMKGSLMGKYCITLDETTSEALLSVEYTKGVISLYAGIIVFFFVGLITALVSGYWPVGLFFGSPILYFLYMLRNAEQRSEKHAQKEVAILISQLR